MGAKSFTGTLPNQNKGQTDTWLTPLWIIESLGSGFDLDPCAFPNHLTAKELITLPTNGLEAPWKGKVWLNPPYSDIEPWLNKLAEHGYGSALVFARTDTKWLQKHMRLAKSVFFMQGRVKFMTSEFETKGNAGTGNVILSYGYTPEYKDLKGWKAK